VPVITKFGARLTADAATVDKVPARSFVFSARPAIQADLWARPGLHPDARLASTINEHVNQGVICRPKEYFRILGMVEGAGFTRILSSFGVGDRARWRFAFRSGPRAHALCAIVGMAPPDSGTNQNSYARLDITNGAGVTVGTTTFVYGANPNGTSGASSGWPLIKQIMAYVDGIPADTELYGTFYDVDYGRLQSGCVFELPSLTENGGYLASNITTHSAILSTHRQYAAETLNALLQKSGATVYCWSVDDGTVPVTRTSSTAANVLDTTITTVSASSPGPTFDMIRRARLSQASGVPIVMKVCARNGSGGSPAGTVKLVDSSGATIVSITNGWTSSPTWQSVTGVLPATSAKYDLQLSTTAGTLSLYAVSIYQYG
jgi:hypothetical protein